MLNIEEQKKFVETFGNRWYLRDLDYLPEPLECYPHNLKSSCVKELNEGKVGRIFNSWDDACEASNKVREILGLEKYDFNYKRKRKDDIKVNIFHMPIEMSEETLSEKISKILRHLDVEYYTSFGDTALFDEDYTKIKNWLLQSFWDMRHIAMIDYHTVYVGDKIGSEYNIAKLQRLYDNPLAEVHSHLEIYLPSGEMRLKLNVYFRELDKWYEVEV